ncbi:MAG: hypothetical protein PHV13_01620 [Candidatus ainarchaeum sp.]|nr:hypothetical protein [Candidatus ainarchaeum sp.]
MKGQYFSFDAIIAAVIFVMALVALLSYWHSVKSYLDYQADPLSRESVRISNLLFTPPSPSPDCMEMSRLGFSLGWDDRRVNSSIVECASLRAGVSPNWLKQMLGTGYDVSITVSDLSSDIPATVAVIGGSADDVKNAKEVVKMRRLATVVNPDGSTYLAAFDLSIYTAQ